ncbi:hypothetical protein [Weissella bombi]
MYDAMKIIPNTKQLSEAMKIIPSTNQLSSIVSSGIAAQMNSFKAIAKQVSYLNNWTLGLNKFTENLFEQQILYCQKTGWLLFDIVSEELTEEYFDIQAQNGNDDEEFDIDDFGLWVIKERQLEDIINEIEQLRLVNGTEHLSKMVAALRHDDQSYKVLFQYVFSLIDATVFYQKRKYDKSTNKPSKYNSQDVVMRFYNDVKLNASLLGADKHTLGLKNIATVYLYKSLYNKNNFRNKLMHGSIKYDELTEVKFYQLVVLLYQLTVNDDIYQFVK